MAAAGGAGIAGCVSGTPLPACEEIVTPVSVSLPVASGGSTSGDLPVEVLHARLTESLVYHRLMAELVKTSDAISDEEGTPLQFLEMAVRITDEVGTPTTTGTGDGNPPGRDVFLPRDLTVSLNLDGETSRPAFSSRVSGSPLPEPPEGQPIGVSVPVSAVEQASVRFEARGSVSTWDVPDELLASFDAVPVFSVQEATITGEECKTTPNDVEHGILELTVENTGDRDGRFQALSRASNGPADLRHYLSVPVPSGESVRVKRLLRKYDPGGIELQGSVDDRVFSYG